MSWSRFLRGQLELVEQLAVCGNRAGATAWVFADADGVPMELAEVRGHPASLIARFCVAVGGASHDV